MSVGQSRLLLVLATALVALVAAIVWLEPPEPTEEGLPTWADAFEGVQGADLTRLEVAGGAAPVVLERAASGWRVVAPLDAPADAARADGAAGALATAQLSEPFDRSDAAPYGLAPASRVVTATTADGRTLRLELGDDSPAGGGTYARDADGALRVTRTRLSASFPLEADAWRSKEVVRLARSAVTSVSVTPAQGAPWQLVRGEDRWWLHQGGRRLLASDRAASDLLDTLSQLRVEAFGDAPLAAAGGTAVTVTESNGATHAISVGPGETGRRVITGPLLDAPAEAEAAALVAALDPRAYPATVLLPVQPGALTGLTVRLGDRALEAERAGDAWSPLGAEDALGALLAVRVDRSMVPPDPEGPAWGELRLRAGEGRDEAVSLHQPHDGGRVAIDARGGAPFVIQAADLERLGAALPPPS